MAPDRQPRGGCLETANQLAQIFQAAAAVVAVVAAAWWFGEQREVYPRADVTQSVEAVRLQPGIAAVEVQVSFRNTGKQLIELTSATVKIQTVSSEPYKIAELADLQEGEYWLSRRPGAANERSQQFSQGELRWPVLKQYTGKIHHRVEPGETDLLVFSFVIPCAPQLGASRTSLQRIRIASDIYKPQIEGEEGFAWKTRSFADLSQVCRG